MPVRHPVINRALILLVLSGLLVGAPARARERREPTGADVPALVPRPNPSPADLPIRPDPRLTPGDTLDVTLEDIRTPGYSARVRNVPISVKREVYAAYGINHWSKGEYEVDHLIPLSIGGSNSKKNLWPQSYQTSPWNARVKDRLEYRLLQLVRAGRVDLRTAQADIARDWIAAYGKYVGAMPKASAGGRRGAVAATQEGIARAELGGDGEPDLDDAGVDAAPTAGSMPSSAPAASSPGQRRELGADARPDTATPPASGAGQVWVNTKSGVIWRPGSRYYGKTAQGRYMTETEAKTAGYHFAGEGR